MLYLVRVRGIFGSESRSGISTNHLPTKNPCFFPSSRVGKLRFKYPLIRYYILPPDSLNVGVYLVASKVTRTSLKFLINTEIVLRRHQNKDGFYILCGYIMLLYVEVRYKTNLQTRRYPTIQIPCDELVMLSRSLVPFPPRKFPRSVVNTIGGCWAEFMDSSIISAFN